MNIREQNEQIEQSILSPFACLSENSTRKIPEKPCPYRTEFQRDRDRILHCNSFRRLKRKTQVFLSPVGDHYRTRLTHTLEVSQIARTMARAMRLNEDLTEAIALGHDLGHSPFGHSGEAVLNQICPHGFKHYLQSVRVVDYIEHCGNGLNLTQQVKNGIACHTNAIANTREGVLVRLADTIAYINHDIDDAIHAGILQNEQLPQDLIAILGERKSKRITTMIGSVIEHGVESIDMMPDIRMAHDKLRDFLFANVYTHPYAKAEEHKAMMLIEKLYYYYLAAPEKLPEEYKKIAKRFDTERAVCDYVSGMSDDFAVALYKELYIPLGWSVI